MNDELYRLHHARLLEIFRRFSYEEREVTLASGAKSNFYFDSKQSVLSAEGHFLVGWLFGRLLAEKAPEVEAVGGLTMGADPLASATSTLSYLSGRNLRAFYVRKEAKGHGTGAFLEGTKRVPAGARVAIVEDVVTTGNASKTAAERLRAHGYIVDTVLTIVDREAGGRDALGALGLTLFSLFTVRDFQSEKTTRTS